MPDVTARKPSSRREPAPRAPDLADARLARPGHPSAAPQAPPGERRDFGSRVELLWRVEITYLDLPGLSLTLPQARRLFGLRDDICARVLDTLVTQSILSCTHDGRYVLDGRQS